MAKIQASGQRPIIQCKMFIQPPTTPSVLRSSVAVRGHPARSGPHDATDSVMCSLRSRLHGSPHGLAEKLPAESWPWLHGDPHRTRPEVGVRATDVTLGPCACLGKAPSLSWVCGSVFACPCPPLCAWSPAWDKRLLCALINTIAVVILLINY